MGTPSAKRVILNTFGSFGDVNPYIALALELQARGHDPVIATCAYYREAVGAAGIAFAPVRPDIDPADSALLRRAMDPRRGTEVILREIVFPAVGDAFTDLCQVVQGADLLITHPICYAGPVVAEKCGLNWVSTVLSPLSFFSVYDFPVLSPSRLWVLLEKFGPGLKHFLKRVIMRTARSWSRSVRQLRADLGLPPGRDPIFEGLHSPDLVLALFSSVLARVRPDWPSHTRVTGFAFFDDAGGRKDLPLELTEFLRAGPAPVVFTLGSAAVHTAGNFYRTAVAAADLLGIRAVLLVGANTDNLPADALPENVIAVERVPFSQLFPHAAAVVHHGGIGTTGQTLRAGLPSLVIPFAHDQPDNARRIERLKVARTLPRTRSSPQSMARALAALLNDPATIARAEKIGQRVRAEDGAAAACDAIEEMLEDKSPSASVLPRHPQPS